LKFEKKIVEIMHSKEHLRALDKKFLLAQLAQPKN
jgi:hypothetical protein